MKKRVLIIDNNTKSIKKIREIFCNEDYEIINFKNLNTLNLNLFTNFILTGGDEVLDNEKFKDELSLIKNTNKPLLGICCGHQLICLAFNSVVLRMKNPRKGRINVKIIKEDTLFKNIDKEFLVYEDHNHNVKKLGEELCELGRSLDGIEIVKHVNKKIYGVQFHPEENFEDSNMKKLINNFLNL